MDLFPLIVLFALNLVDEFDIAALSILGPEIRDAFGLTNAQLGTIRALPAIVGLAIPLVGWLGDRSNRVRLAWMGAIVWGVFAFSTGLANVVAVLVLFRIGSGTGKLVSGAVHPSLLTDYYPPAVTRSRVQPSQVGRRLGCDHRAGSRGADRLPARLAVRVLHPGRSRPSCSPTSR